ncbi:recombinase family protein [Haloferax volcanii]|uniref:recombinase family protein n=1 Tax=Haloferax volcanii TaxID=2246 RepID=UPI001C988A08|nr:recombinase family protein [Haloferax volcanii]
MKVGCYCRVSTPEQNLDRQIESTTTYSQSELDVALSELQVYRDKATGTNTSREGYKRLMGDVEAGEVDTVVVHEISRLARSLQDLDRTVSRVMESGATIHSSGMVSHSGMATNNPCTDYRCRCSERSRSGRRE